MHGQIGDAGAALARKRPQLARNAADAIRQGGDGAEVFLGMLRIAALQERLGVIGVGADSDNG